MPILINENNAHISLGTGDVYMLVGSQKDGRSYVLLTACDPGVVGAESVTGRTPLFKDDAPIDVSALGAHLSIESSTVESLDGLIATLRDYRALLASNEIRKLPDGSGAFTVSMKLPETH